MTYRPNGTWKRPHSRQQPFPDLFWRTREAPVSSFAFLETPALTRTKPERPSSPTRIFVSRFHDFDDIQNSHTDLAALKSVMLFLPRISGYISAYQPLGSWTSASKDSSNAARLLVEGCVWANAGKASRGRSICWNCHHIDLSALKTNQLYFSAPN